VTARGAGIQIDRCVCLGIRFADLLPLERSGDWELDRLIVETGCGEQCGLCRPYLRRMLTDGTTVFREILTED
jgi:bacterioferritin-associated ferredoxin